jgi:hypothetical protein
MASTMVVMVLVSMVVMVSVMMVHRGHCVLLISHGMCVLSLSHVMSCTDDIATCEVMNGGTFLAALALQYRTGRGDEGDNVG